MSPAPTPCASRPPFGDALAQQPAPPRLHRHTPLDTAVPLGTLLHSLVAVAPRRRLSAMQQRSRLRTSLALAAVVVKLCADPRRPCVDGTSGVFFVDDGASMMLASTIVPVRSDGRATPVRIDLLEQTLASPTDAGSSGWSRRAAPVNRSPTKRLTAREGPPWLVLHWIESIRRSRTSLIGSGASSSRAPPWWAIIQSATRANYGTRDLIFPSNVCAAAQRCSLEARIGGRSFSSAASAIGKRLGPVRSHASPLPSRGSTAVVATRSMRSCTPARLRGGAIIGCSPWHRSERFR